MFEHARRIQLPDFKSPKVKKTGAIATGLAGIAIGLAWTIHKSSALPPVIKNDLELKYSKLAQTDFTLISTEKGVSIINKGQAERVDEISKDSSEATWIVDLKDGRRFAFHISNEKRESILSTKPINDSIFHLNGVNPTAAMTLEQERMSEMKKSGNRFVSLLIQLVPLGAILGFYYWMGRKAGLLGGKSDKDIQVTDRPNERFEDFGGEKALIAQGKELLERIERFKKGDPTVTLPKGILLRGGPGVGKTHYARCLAGEADCPFLAPDSAKLMSSSFVGAWVRALQNVYEKGRKLIKDFDKKKKNPEERQVIFIFLDEIDSVAQSRSDSGDPVSKEYAKVVNALLQEMDGVDKNKNIGIITIGSTNLGNTIDDALLRPGRFTEQYTLEGPKTSDDRLEVLRVVARTKCKDSNLDPIDDEILESFSKASQGLTPDQLRAIIERAAGNTVRAKEKVIPESELYDAFQFVLCGPPQDTLINDARMQFVAMHEHGHGLVAYACGITPLIISMRPRGTSLGRVVIDADQLVEEPIRRANLLKAMLIAAGGRAGELIDAGEAGESAGVRSDFEKLEEIVDLFIASGMVSHRYDGHLIINGDVLSEEHIKLRKTLIVNAIDASTQVLDVIGQKAMQEMSGAITKGYSEIVGHQASEYYDAFISSNQLEEMQKIVSSFIDNPMRGIKNDALHMEAS